MVTGNRVLRIIFGHKREEGKAGWKKITLHYITLRSGSVLFTTYQINENEIGEACSTHGRDEKCTFKGRDRLEH
jgi:hypothetical protein